VGTFLWYKYTFWVNPYYEFPLSPPVEESAAISGLRKSETAGEKSGEGRGLSVRHCRCPSPLIHSLLGLNTCLGSINIAVIEKYKKYDYMPCFNINSVLRVEPEATYCQLIYIDILFVIDGVKATGQPGTAPSGGSRFQCTPSNLPNSFSRHRRSQSGRRRSFRYQVE
jgi:hypothetical protein